VLPYYDRLSALDATFLHLDDATSHMHVAATLLFDAAPLRGPRGGLDMERIRAYIASRLHRIPRYRQRLAHVPLERHPVWVDDDRFNIFYHVRHTALPKPGEERQLKRLCGRLLSQKLDFTKPLWEMWVIEGLEGDRIALVAKAHHAMVDGIAGMQILTELLSPAPSATFDPAPPWAPRPAPTAAQLVVGELWRRAAGAVGAVRTGVDALGAPGETLRAARDRAQGVLEALQGGTTPASDTPLNPTTISPHRRFDWVRFPLDDVKDVKRRLGGTINDVVLATVVGAARRFLTARGMLAAELDFRALVPVSVRSVSRDGDAGNRVANFIARLPIDEADPAHRYARVRAEMAAQKQSHVLEGAELLEELANWTSATWLSQLMRLSTRRRAYNMVVTNVPGPQLPLYLLDAPLREPYPMVPLFENQAVGVALFSDAGGLFWGLNADWDAGPDLHDFATALGDAFDELGRAARAA
jgi:WS/DGAT/MGAT family acyltransferase